MKSIRKTPRGDRHSLVATTPTAVANSNTNGATNDLGHNGRNPVASHRTTVPQLDEESLKVNTPRTPSGAAAVFTLVPHNDDRLKSGGSTVLGSPQNPSHKVEDGQLFTMMQQQQVVAMAAAQLEQAYSQTCYMLQQCSHNALLTVLMSLLNDYPTTLVQPIRMRVEQVLAHQMSPSATSNMTMSSRRANHFVPNSSAAPWTPSNMRGSAAPTPTANSTTPNHRRGRGHKSKEEDQEMCSIHNNMRAMKHLQLNATTGLYECIHGFHCLVDASAEPSPKRATAASAMTPSASPSRVNGSVPSADIQPFVMPTTAVSPSTTESRFSVSEVEALRMLGYSFQKSTSDLPQSSFAHDFAAPNLAAAHSHQPFAHPSLQSSSPGLTVPSHQDPDSAPLGNGCGFTVMGGEGTDSGGSPLDTRLHMDIPSLEYLLQSVRDIDDD